MSYPISMIPYANMAPYQELGPPSGCHFVNSTPRQSIRALQTKTIWAAALPVGGLQELEGVVEPMGRFGIAAQRVVMSVLLFSDRPFEAFRFPQAVRLSTESATSVRLLYLLLGYQHGFDAIPHPAKPDEQASGELVIGDKALQWRRQHEADGRTQGYEHVTDLADLWYARHRLPFVFARWVVHRQAPPGLVPLLEDWLQNFALREAELIQQVAPKVAERLKLPLDYAQRYLNTIQRCLDETHMAGQARYMEDLHRHAVFEDSFPWAEALAHDAT